ncbi:translation initiation factor eIF-2 beta subunit, partial [Neophaeococcomyces mojaviensis]
MAEVEQPLPERKARKSVAFSEGTTIMETNGTVSAALQDGKSTAEKHSSSQVEKDVDEVTD